MIRDWFKSGSPWIWLNAAAVSASLIIVLGLLGLIAVRGLGHFWPADVVQVQYTQPGNASMQVIGEQTDTETVTLDNLRSAGFTLETDKKHIERHLIKTGNRDVLGSDFRWLVDPYITARQFPQDIVVLERREWGNFYGYLKAIKENGKQVAEGETSWTELENRLERVLDIFEQIRDIEKGAIGDINYAIEDLRLEKRRLELDGEDTPENLKALVIERKRLEK
ncbi:MAG: phosphate ABC transporter, permease protein PstA, partial [Gammaproteobacteria bacterium]|nr:phosphate ABC transporter, permease protein PstA [Gammaproteobacteria bacterium]